MQLNYPVKTLNSLKTIYASEQKLYYSVYWCYKFPFNILIYYFGSSLLFLKKSIMSTTLIALLYKK